MLTKSDLNAIDKIVSSRICEEIEPVRKDVNGLKQDMGVVKQEVRALQQDVGGLRVDTGGIKKEMKTVKKSIEKIDKNVSVMLNMLNTDDMHLLKRVRRVEDHLKLPPLQN